MTQAFNVPAKLKAQAEMERRRRQWKADCRRYRDDPAGYARQMLGMELTADQRSMLTNIVRERRSGCKAAHAIGKCLAWNEPVMLSDGRMMFAHELVGKHFGVLAWDETTGQQVPSLAWASINGVCPTYRLTTESGRTIVRTANHPLWASRAVKGIAGRIAMAEAGWVALGDLSVDREQVVLVPKELHVGGGRPAQEHLVKFAAYLLGDGGTTVSVRFTQQEGPAKDEFIAIAEMIGCKVARPDHLNLILTGHSGAKGTNPAIELVRKWGFFGKGARQKRIPRWIWALPNEQLALFLNRFFACDGWAFTSKPKSAKAGMGNAVIGVTLASYAMIRDIELAMLRLGIYGRVRHKPTKYKGEYRDAWEWAITEGESIRRFSEVVGILGKENAVQRVVDVVAQRSPAKMHRWRRKGCPPGYRWERIKSIEACGDQQTVAITVPGHETYLTSFVEHNSVVAGLAANWWHDCFETSICYVTAPTWTAARDRTFKQARLIREERVPIYARGRILETGKIEDSDPTLKLKHFIQAINAESGEGFQGEHSARILVILEEAVGVPAYIWEAADKGLMTAAENRLFAIANPTDEATLFGAYCADGDTCIITVSALDHPNIQAELHGQPAPFPGACSLTWLYDELKKECEPARPGDPGAFEFWSLSTIRACLDGAPIGAQERPAMAWYLPNAIFQGRVLGLFPQEANQQVIPPSWLEHLARLEPDKSELPEIGADIARHGDDRTGIATRWGACLYALEVLRQMSLEVVTDNIRLAIHAAATLDGSNFDPKSIPCRIDITGGLGAGPYDRLAAEGYSVIGVNSSETAIDDENYPNKRSELWFSTREMVRARQFDDSRLPPDVRAMLRRELSTPKWKPDAKGRKVVDPKKDTKKILKWSPDLADAVLLAYYAGEPPRHLERVDASGLEIDFARLGGRG